MQWVDIYLAQVNGWGFTALRDSISVYIGPSPREGEKKEKTDEGKKSKQRSTALMQAQ